MPVDPFKALLALVLVLLLLSLGNARWSQPLVSVANRWLRWLFAAGLFAFTLDATGWLPRPLWQLLLVGFLVWFLVETFYNWVLVGALSRSELPLFPRFQVNAEGDEWPVNRQSILVRDWLRSQGFQRLQSLKAPLAPNLALRSSIYQNDDRSVRCQILFLPKGGGNLTMAYVLTTKTTDGERLITDNSFMPFAAYYPEKWFVERYPLMRSLPKLLKRHHARGGYGECYKPMAKPPSPWWSARPAR